MMFRVIKSRLRVNMREREDWMWMDGFTIPSSLAVILFCNTVSNGK